MLRLLATTLGVACLLAPTGCDPVGNAQSPGQPFTSVSDPTAPAPAKLDPPPKTSDAPEEAAPRPAEQPAAKQQPAEPTDPDRLVDKSFDDLVFDIEPDAPFARDMLTDPIEALNGQRMRIRGYILPTAQKRGIKQFVLVRDNQECCFGPGAALYDCILISMQPGQSAEFSIRPVSVTGRFAIEEFPGPDGKPLAIYQMQGEQVE